MNIRRRSSLLEQYSVRVPTSRLKERQAQSRHHEFLLRKDNKSAIDMILDRVRDLAEVYSSARASSTPLSPMEKAKLLAWADDVEKVMYDFVPSENHDHDPIVHMLGKLQFLQDGHVCLAEVAVDARALLERWERDGIFDMSDSSDDDSLDSSRGIDAITEDDSSCGDAQDGDGNDSHFARSVKWRRDRDRRHLQHSYAYETVRQRAAANMIKRCVLRWARSQASFRDRVDEIQIFGKTTSSLMKELTSTASARRPSSDVPPSDIFDLVKVKRDGLYAHSIGFTDLMHFAKHVALFSVDQAIRTVEDLEMKRYLFLTRCALKLQTTWRKARKAFQARRMRKLVEELRRQREQQEQDERAQQLQLNASVSSTPDTSDGKRRSVLSSTKKTRPPPVSTSPSTGSSRAPSRGDEQTASTPSTPQSPRPRASVSGAAKRKESSSSKSRGGISSVSESAQERRRQLNKVKSVSASSRFDDDDGDTRDVESAWQSFLDSTATDANAALVPVTELSDAMGESTLDGDGHAPVAHAVMPELTEDDWRNWSDGDESAALLDDEADLEAEERIARQLRLAVSTALPSTPAAELALLIDQSDDGLAATSSSAYPVREPHVTIRHGSQSTTTQDAVGESTSLPVSLFAVDLGDGVDRFRAKKIRVRTVSRMAPFAELDSTRASEGQASTTAAAARRKSRKPSRVRLQDVDFGRASTHLALLELVDPLVDDDTDGDDGDGDRSHSGDESASEIPGNEQSRRNPQTPLVAVRRKGSMRKRRVERLKHAITVRETENITYAPAKRESHQTMNGARKLIAVEQRERELRGRADERSERFTYPVQSACHVCCVGGPGWCSYNEPRPKWHCCVLLLPRVR